MSMELTPEQYERIRQRFTEKTTSVGEIRQRITQATGARTATQLSGSGIAVGVQLPDGGYLWSVVPIDEESRDAFVDYLVAQWRKVVAA